MVNCVMCNGEAGEAMICEACVRDNDSVKIFVQALKEVVEEEREIRCV